MKKIVLGLLLIPSLALADGVYTRTKATSQVTSSGGATSPGGSSGQVQWNSGGSFAGVSGSTVDVSGNVTFGGILSAPTVNGDVVLTGVGTSSIPTHSFILDPDTGMYRSAANELGFVTGGTRRMAINQTGSGFMSTVTIGTNTPQSAVSLSVLGNIYAANFISTSAWVNVGSPTTPPTCNAANKGNVFMNTTTNCLNYCDGTANRQVTSAAATCT